MDSNFVFLTPESVTSLPPVDPVEEMSSFELTRYSKVLKELEARKIAALNLYEPLPYQEAYHACRAKEVIIQKATQTGGSLAGFVEVARAICGVDPYLKYPKKDGIAVCLGYGEKHVGRVIHKYLFRAGAFRIIKDNVTTQWRTFRPWDPGVLIMGKPGDAGREEESRPAPPLIPARFIKGKIAWEKRAEHVFSYVQFINGWELHAANSAGESSQAQGFQVDLYDIDEDLATPHWHEEATSRTAIRKGKIRWHALPHSKTEDLMNMIYRAEEEEQAGVELSKRVTVRIIATMYDNPYYPEESRRDNERIWKSHGEDVFRKRALGEIVTDTILMYPTFNLRIHDALRSDTGVPRALEILRVTDGHPPPDWTRYMVVDPGHTICAVGFFATPPPELGDVRIMYDELYLHQCDKHMFVKNVKAKINDEPFEDFIIDMHGANIRELGSGILPRRQYEQEMEKQGIVCAARGSRFKAGSDDIKGREEKLREWLALRDDGYPTFFVVKQRCPGFIKEIARFKKKIIKIGGREVPSDDGVRKMTHAVEAAEYSAADGLPYVKPQHNRRGWSMIDRILKERKLRAQEREMRHWDPSKSGRSLGPRGVSVA